MTFYFLMLFFTSNYFRVFYHSSCRFSEIPLSRSSNIISFFFDGSRYNLFVFSFQSITGIDDVAEAIFYLEESHWDLLVSVCVCVRLRKHCLD